VEVGPFAKRAKIDTNGASSILDIASPTKRRKLEEDGLLMLSSKDDKIEDDVIEID
jgi:ubiquitin-like 1-activating enzyme E1 B